MALSDIRAKVLQNLGDPNGDRFSDDAVDEAIRLALGEYDQYMPYALADDVTANGTKEIPLTEITETILRVFRVVWELESIAFYAYVQAGVHYITTSMLIPNGETLSIHYTKSHTVDGLDSATETTVEDIETLALGAAGHALLARSISTAETNNLNQGVSDNLKAAGLLRLEIFHSRLAGGVRSGNLTWTYSSERFG